MADVFLSYARADRGVAERLADAIQASGRTVWWDRHIKGGTEFSQEIEQQLAFAGHVLVLWSKDAAKSRWVKDEVRLIDARTSEQLWSKVYDGLATDLGSMQDRIAAELGAALRARLGVGQGTTAERSGIDPRAYEAYLKGVERLSVRYQEESRQEALEQFQLATSIQPDFADAYAGAAYLLSLSVPPQLSMTWDEIKQAQRKANQKALDLDPDNLLALIARSNASHNFDGDIEASFRDARKVLEVAPDFGPAHYSLASTYVMAGAPRESLPHFDRAIASDPFNKVIRLFRSVGRYQLGDYQGVRKEALECESACQDLHGVWFETLIAHGTPGDLERDLDAVLRGFGEDFSSEVRRELRLVATSIIRGKPFRLDPPEPNARGYPFAAALAAAGQTDHAFQVARYTASRAQTDEILILMADGRLDFPPELRADPRYHALFNDFPNLKRMAATRRRNGALAGLPIQPTQVAAENKRLASLRK